MIGGSGTLLDRSASTPPSANSVGNDLPLVDSVANDGSPPLTSNAALDTEVREGLHTCRSPLCSVTCLSATLHHHVRPRADIQPWLKTLQRSPAVGWPLSGTKPPFPAAGGQ